MSTPDDDDLQQGLAGALLGPGQPSPFPGLALSLLGGPAQVHMPGNPISLAQGLTLGLPATSGAAPGAPGPSVLTPAPTASAAQAAAPFDVDKAIQYLDGNAQPESTNRCAKAVRLAIAAGGRQVANTDYAKDYGPKLVDAGFNQLDAQELKNYTPEKGDVVVYPASPGHDSGHMGMYDGTQWVSDFKQRNRWIDRHGRPEPAYSVYRP